MFNSFELLNDHLLEMVEIILRYIVEADFRSEKLDFINVLRLFLFNKYQLLELLTRY
jgi:hypothetical protein